DAPGRRRAPRRDPGRPRRAPATAAGRPPHQPVVVDGGPDMAPNPPNLRSAPAEPWRPSLTRSGAVAALVNPTRAAPAEPWPPSSFPRQGALRDRGVEGLVVLIADEVVEIAPRLHALEQGVLGARLREERVALLHRPRGDAQRGDRPDDHLVAETGQLVGGL